MADDKKVSEKKTGLAVRALLWLSNLHRRLLGIAFVMMGPRRSYEISGRLARVLYQRLPAFRMLSEAQCRAALGDQIDPADVPRLAEDAFVHRVWNLVDLPLAERLLHPKTYEMYGGRIPEPWRTEMLAAQKRGQSAILVSAYYGPFDLLPVFLGFNGIPAAVIYRPHGNLEFDRYRRRVRSRSGCQLVPVEQAADTASQVLDAGRAVAIVADHHETRRGWPATFLGLPTLVSRSVGLLACRHDADVVVAGIRRVKSSFQFAIEVQDIIKHEEWADQPDPVEWVTQRYLRGLERLILADPSQYLWGYARWGTETADRLMRGSTWTDTPATSAQSAPAGGVDDTRSEAK